MNFKFKKQKLKDYFFNTLLVVVVLILLIPSMRVRFQGWFQSFFLSDAIITKQMNQSIEASVLNWQLFDTQYQLHAFSEFTSKPIVLSFWATWCPPCRAELPELKELNEELKNKLHVVAVSEESVDIILKSELAEDYNFLYSTQSIPASFKVNSYPTLLIIDKNFNIVYRQEGAANLNTEANKNFLNSLANE